MPHDQETLSFSQDYRCRGKFQLIVKIIGPFDIPLIGIKLRFG